MKLFAQDKANHYAYGSWAAALAAVVALVLVAAVSALLRDPAPLQLTPLAGAVAAVLAAWLVGEWKEARDELANTIAELAGQPKPHDVSRADVQATTWGALPVAAPLLALQAVLLLMLPN